MKTKLLILLTLLTSCTMEKPNDQEPFKKPINVLVIGNSIVNHPPNSSIGWFNDCGMAATEPKKDFANLTRENLNNYFTVNKFQKLPTWNWEVNFSPENLTSSDIVWDLIIVKVGENVSDLKAYRKHFPELINFYNTTPDTKIIVLSSVWTNPEKDSVTQQICQQGQYYYCNLSLMQSNSQNYAWEEYENMEVRCHPNNQGMMFIKNRVMDITLQAFGI